MVIVYDTIPEKKWLKIVRSKKKRGERIKALEILLQLKSIKPDGFGLKNQKLSKSKWLLHHEEGFKYGMQQMMIILIEK